MKILSVKAMEHVRGMTEAVVDQVSGLTVRRKMDVVLFFGFLLFPMALLLLGQAQDQTLMNNIIVIYFVCAVVLFVPLSNLLSHLIAVRNIRELNEQCLRLKGGDYALGEIPCERGGEHDFFSLKSNLHWMGYAIASREKRLTDAMDKLAEAQRQIEDSIDYAGLIQTSFLPDSQEFESVFRSHFLLWDQRDKVGGDSYWFKWWGTGFFVAIVDCTGHGVPGAFMTLIVHSLFEKVAAGYGGSSPAAVLGRMNCLIKDSLKQYDVGSGSDDGMDCALCYVEPRERKLVFAGADMSIFILEKGRVRRVKGDRCGIGYVRSPVDFTFTDREIILDENARVYMVTDGLTDQVGGPKRFPFGRKRLEAFIEDNARIPVEHQGALLERTVDDYRGRESRRDDITALGFEL